MAKPRVIFVIAFIAIYPLAFAFARKMEVEHRFDSIGLWYTLFVSALLAVAAAVVVVFAVLVTARVRARRSHAPRQ